MAGLLKQLKIKLKRHIIDPMLESHAPLKEAALGSAVGMFFGMTPTVGVQMWMVFMCWITAKYIFRYKFDLIIATAMVWLSNPLTMGPLYYLFLASGGLFFKVAGIRDVMISYQDFSGQLDQITHNPALSTIDKFAAGVQFMFIDLGYPMIIGSLFWAIPLAILAYFATLKYLKQYRIRKATNLGLSYEEWKEKYERSV